MKIKLSQKVWYMAAMLSISAMSCKKAQQPVESNEGGSDKNSSSVSATLTIPARTIPTAAIKNLFISDDYRVMVKLRTSGTYLEVPVYKTNNVAVNRDGSERRSQTSASFANFSFTNDGSIVDVRVIALKTAISSLVIRPLGYGISSSKPSSWEVLYSLNTPRKVSVEINGSANPLFIYGNPPEPAANTTPGTGGTVYNYGPGVHDIGLAKRIKSGDRVNMRAGAIVQGSFRLDNGATDVKFLGHGILTTGTVGWALDDREQFYNSPFSGTSPFANGVKNVVWQGLTIVNSPSWVFSCMFGNTSTGGHMSSNNTMRDLKQVHWHPETDPIWFDGDYNTVADCFLFANDDVTSHGSNNCTLSNMVIWQGGNGGHLLLLDNWSSSNTITFDGIHLIGQDNVMETVYLKGNQNKNTTFSNITLKNITIERRTAPSGYWKNRLFNIDAKGTGSFNVSNVTFDNFKILGAQQPGVDGEGILNPKGTATGIEFINFYINGTKMWSLTQARMTKNANVTAPTFQ